MMELLLRSPRAATASTPAFALLTPTGGFRAAVASGNTRATKQLVMGGVGGDGERMEGIKGV